MNSNSNSNYTPKIIHTRGHHSSYMSENITPIIIAYSSGITNLAIRSNARLPRLHVYFSSSTGSKSTWQSGPGAFSTPLLEIAPLFKEFNSTLGELLLTSTSVAGPADSCFHHRRVCMRHKLMSIKTTSHGGTLSSCLTAAIIALR